MKKALVALAFGGFGIGMTEFVIMGILPDVAEALHITIPQAGHFISAYAMGVVVGAPLLTAICRKWPGHRVLFGLMIWFTVFNTASAFASSYTSMLVMRFLAALPHGAFFGIGAVVAGELAQPGKEARAIATMFTGLTVANVVGVPLGTYMGHAYGWYIAFLLVGVIGLVTLASIFFWMPELPASSTKPLREDMRVFKRPQLWLVFVLTTIGTGGFFAWYSYIAPLITEVAGHADYIVTYAMILAGLGMTVGNLLGAKLAEVLNPLKAVLIALVLMAVGLAANTYFASGKVSILVMTFIIGVIAFCISTPVQMMMINASVESKMLGSSLNQSAFNIGNAIGAFLAGLPIAFGYGLVAADWVGVGLASCGIIMTLIIFATRRSPVNESELQPKTVNT